MPSYENPISQHMPPRIITALKVLRSSFLLFVMTVGVIFVLIGLVLQYILSEGILAGMFGIWGLSTLLAAGVAYTVLRYLQ